MNNLKYGYWYMDDSLTDPTGFGQTSGNEDGSIGDTDWRNQNDCKLWFNIKQNDYDDDEVTYWKEIKIYESDPTSSSSPGWVGYFVDSQIYENLTFHISTN